MLRSVADRLMQTLSIRHFAFFLNDAPGWRMRMSHDASALPLHSPASLDLSFLDWPQTAPYIFFERTRYPLDAIAGSWPATVRQTIADLDLNYYVPCTVRGRTIAFLGVSRTEKGEFLSSDDVELLQTLSNYVGIATENANLYRSLKQKVDEYERLKEFSENIVESINVGILARVNPEVSVVITVHVQRDLLGVRQFRGSNRRGIVRVNRYEIAEAPLAAGLGAEVLDPFGALALQARVDNSRVLWQRPWTGGGW